MKTSFKITLGAALVAVGLFGCGDDNGGNPNIVDEPKEPDVDIIIDDDNWVIEEDYFTDERDGQRYRMVKMPDGKWWMAENLNYRADDTEWPKNDVTRDVNINDKGSWCYGNSANNCEKYGRLYTWSAAIEACPTGWHLPTDDEWEALADTIGGRLTAGTKLRATDWVVRFSVPVGTDDYGFTALPAGRRYSNVSSFSQEIGEHGYWWTATQRENNAQEAWYRRMTHLSELLERGREELSGGFSVRCIRDN